MSNILDRIFTEIISTITWENPNSSYNREVLENEILKREENKNKNILNELNFMSNTGTLIEGFFFQVCKNSEYHNKKLSIFLR